MVFVSKYHIQCFLTLMLASDVKWRQVRHLLVQIETITFVRDSQNRKIAFNFFVFYFKLRKCFLKVCLTYDRCVQLKFRFKKISKIIIC